MSREWQQTRLPEYVMPNAVYYQSLWAVRDLERMEERLGELGDRRREVNSANMAKEPTASYNKSSLVENVAMEAAILEERISGIHKALDQVPVNYRDCIMRDISQQDVVSIYPSRLWKIWKQKFLYGVAKNLSIM